MKNLLVSIWNPKGGKDDRFITRKYVDRVVFLVW